MAFYIYDYLKETNKPEAELLDLLKYELDKSIYYFGEHFIAPLEHPVNKSMLKKTARNVGAGSVRLNAVISQRGRLLKSNNIIISSAYFNLNNEINDLGFSAFLPVWMNALPGKDIYGSALNHNCLELKGHLDNLTTSTIFSNQLRKSINKFRDQFMEFSRKPNIKALILSNDLGFFERLAIGIFRKIGKPSFVFLHGLPGRYNKFDDNRADYLIVWGNKIRDHYIAAGVKPEKIFVSGHPFYKTIDAKKVSRFDFRDILIITKSLNGAPPLTNGTVLSDRGNLILYLISIRNVLTPLGIKSVRLRLHPSENPEWYSKMVGTDFFKIDRLTLKDSLRKSTLVIGPTSTVFLEALIAGVNYICYEPEKDGLDLINFPLVPPFDGSNPGIPVAKNEKDLGHILAKKIFTDTDILHEYLRTPFSLDFISKLIEN